MRTDGSVSEGEYRDLMQHAIGKAFASLLMAAELLSEPIEKHEFMLDCAVTIMGNVMLNLVKHGLTPDEAQGILARNAALILETVDEAIASGGQDEDARQAGADAAGHVCGPLASRDAAGAGCDHPDSKPDAGDWPEIGAGLTRRRRCAARRWSRCSNAARRRISWTGLLRRASRRLARS